MHRYLELVALQEAGEIAGLERQPRYILVGSQKREDGTTERPVSYTADFRYTDKEGKIIVEDVKSPRTRKNPEYIIKRKLMLERYGITIRRWRNGKNRRLKSKKSGKNDQKVLQ